MSVGVVAEQGVVVLHDQRVHRAGPVGAFGQGVRDVGRRFLVWYGHIQSPSAAAEELEYLHAEIVGRDVVQTVDHVLRRLLGEQAVDEGRPAVIDRMTDHTVLIGRIHCENSR
jgi:hypothetical protein